MAAHQEQVGIEGSDGTEAQSSKDVNADVSKSENIDGQSLDGDNDLCIEIDKHSDGSLSFDGGLCVIIKCK